MSRGVENLVAGALRATLRNPRQSAYLARFAAASRRSSKKRAEAERRGEHVPPFLIASITSSCNLHCAGCYSRCSHATTDEAPVSQLSAGEWETVFAEADDLGVSFILLAGGEPLLRRDVVEAAGSRQGILFPIFTNGTFMDEDCFRLFDRGFEFLVRLRGDPRDGRMAVQHGRIGRWGAGGGLRGVPRFW